MQKISAVIIVHNEEHHIDACLKNIHGVVDEIVIMDSCSTDRTVERCRVYTDRIFIQDFKGFGPQKQDAVNKAQHDWILQIDADERLSRALTEEIRTWRSTDPGTYAGYAIPFHFYFMGRRMRFGGCSGEKHVRLFKKTSATYGSKMIHERIRIAGQTGSFKNRIDHYSYESLEEYLKKFNHYTTLIAREKYAQGKRFHIWQMARLPAEFVIRYVVKAGFLDAMPGLVYALISSYYGVMKHIKLWEIERGNNKDAIEQLRFNKLK